ncbi:MAG: hypothetical protein V4540_14495 [Pseudomonadota bacterium]
MSGAYFEELKALAREKRQLYEVDTAALGLREVRKIYKAEGITIDYWPLPRKIKAVYMCADGDFSVAVQKALPDAPKLFALIHELKHHFCDQGVLGQKAMHCGDYNMSEPLEVGAEVFSAEFIYPEAEFFADLQPLRISTWTAVDVVRLKRHCKAKVSYRYLCKRLQHLGLIAPGSFDHVKFQNLEDELFGAPYHRRVRAVGARLGRRS